MLVLTFENNEHEAIGLGKSRISIGRHPNNDVVLPHTWVSGFHAEIISESNGKCYLVDLGSTNGCHVNGTRISGRMDLAPGNIISIHTIKIAVAQHHIEKHRIPGLSVLPWKNRYAILHSKHNSVQEKALVREDVLAPIADLTQEKSLVDYSAWPHLPLDELELKSAMVQNSDFRCLIVVSGLSSGASFEVRGNINIGRASGNDIVLEDITVSGRHAGLTYSDEGWIIEDLGSFNGLQVNGEKVNRVIIQPGDKLTLGTVELQYAYRNNDTIASRTNSFFGKRREKAIPHFRPLLAEIVESANKTVDAETSTLFLPDNNSKELWSCILHNSSIAEIRIPYGKGLAGSVYITGKTINVLNAYADCRFHREIDEISGSDTRSVLCMPVINHNGKTIGVIQVLNKINAESFSHGDEQKLQSFTKQVAQVLESAGNWKSLIRGLLAVIVVTVLAYSFHNSLPLAVKAYVGAPLVAVLFGVLVKNTVILPLTWLPGIQFAFHTMLRVTIVLLGARLAFDKILTIGAQSLLMIVILLITVIAVVHIIAHMIKVPTRLATLIAVGTAICGNSAIAAVAPVIKAKEEELSFAIAANTLMGTLTVLLYPLIGAFFGFSDPVFGTWAGLAVNDTAQVVAAGFAFSPQAGEIATVVKLTRNTTMAFVIVAVGLVYARWVGGQVGGKKIPFVKRLKHSFPGFIIGFFIAASLNTLGLFTGLSDLSGRDIHGDIKMLTMLLILASLAGVGLGTDLSKMKKTGLRPLYIAIAASLTTALGGYALIKLFGPAV